MRGRPSSARSITSRPGDAAGRLVPDRADPEQREDLGDVVAGRAHRADVPQTLSPTDCAGRRRRGRGGSARPATRPSPARSPTPAATGRPWGRRSRSSGRSGSTLTSPRSGEPDGPAGMKPPSRACRTRGISCDGRVEPRHDLLRREPEHPLDLPTSAARASARRRRGAASGPSRRPPCPRRGRAPAPRPRRPGPWARRRRRPSASRRPGRLCSPPHIWRARRIASTRSTRTSPAGAAPRMCRPSRIWTSLISQSQPSTCRMKSSNSASCGRSSRPRSWSSFAACISVQICWRIAGSLAGSSAATFACSSSSCSSRAMSP